MPTPTRLTARPRTMPILLPTDLAAHYLDTTPAAIYQHAHHGRLTNHGRPTKGGARWDLAELEHLRTTMLDTAV